jgi:hypothetical protein
MSEPFPEARESYRKNLATHVLPEPSFLPRLEAQEVSTSTETIRALCGASLTARNTGQAHPCPRNPKMTSPPSTILDPFSVPTCAKTTIRKADAPDVSRKCRNGDRDFHSSRTNNRNLNRFRYSTYNYERRGLAVDKTSITYSRISSINGGVSHECKQSRRGKCSSRHRR